MFHVSRGTRNQNAEVIYNVDPNQNVCLDVEVLSLKKEKLVLGSE